jgi:hypothetical protein
MNINPIRIAKKIRNEARSRIGKFRFSSQIDFRGKKASDKIFELMSSDRPCLIARFGSLEIRILQLLDMQSSLSTEDLATNDQIQLLYKFGGFYPIDRENIYHFRDLCLELMPAIDILGSWCMEELYFKRFLNRAIKIGLSDLEPYYHSEPWTKVLRGKNILVVNPLNRSIEIQYNKRAFLFANQDVLPAFKLNTYKSIYEFNTNERRFASWFDALNKMKNDIANLSFDVCILGCGPFGLPLGYFIKKELGRKALVLGGATQVLFGIKGKRWDSMPEVSKLYNDYWIYPSEEETPRNADTLEKGCYWK